MREAGYYAGLTQLAAQAGVSRLASPPRSVFSGGWLPLSVAAFAAVLAAAQPQLMRALSSVVEEE